MLGPSPEAKYTLEVAEEVVEVAGEDRQLPLPRPAEPNLEPPLLLPVQEQVRIAILLAQGIGPTLELFVVEGLVDPSSQTVSHR